LGANEQEHYRKYDGSTPFGSHFGSFSHNAQRQCVTDRQTDRHADDIIMPIFTRPDSLLRLWRYINHLLTYLLCTAGARAWCRITVSQPCSGGRVNLLAANDRPVQMYRHPCVNVNVS